MRDSLLIESFLEMMSAERGAAANTLTAYERDLNDFSEYLKASLARANTESIRGWITSMERGGISASSQARKLSALRQLYRFMFSEGLREDDPTGSVDSPRTGRPLPKVISEADVDGLLMIAEEEAQNGSKPAAQFRAARMHALLELLYATGLRVSELVSLPVTATRRDTRFLLVTGKGNKERMVPLGDKAKQAVATYHAIAKAHLKGPEKQMAFPIIRRTGPSDPTTFCP